MGSKVAERLKKKERAWKRFGTEYKLDWIKVRPSLWLFLLEISAILTVFNVATPRNNPLQTFCVDVYTYVVMRRIEIEDSRWKLSLIEKSYCIFIRWEMSINDCCNLCVPIFHLSCNNRIWKKKHIHGVSNNRNFGVWGKADLAFQIYVQCVGVGLSWVRILISHIVNLARN